MKPRNKSTGYPSEQEFSASLVDIKLPKGAQTTRGCPSASPTKKNLKTKPFKPSQFEHIQPKCQMETVDSKSFTGLWDMAQSEFYLNQGFLYEIDKVAERINFYKAGPCDISHWMSMPTMGHLMEESKLLPINHPNNNPPIFLGLTETPHFVVLKMKDENSFPAAQLEKNWEHIATTEATQWKIGI
ncbi:hypothetical protein VP01_386g10 [Puccinia sorghi]|uniref:Uncharacterized protein n=1 Tax=Puccinia sorghi TaxID=27349 RepID=A0A0L6USY4_9BASI|nr:hypothetical protein VP01_386g10 [Puccinia sorghi]